MSNYDNYNINYDSIKLTHNLTKWVTMIITILIMIILNYHII